MGFRLDLDDPQRDPVVFMQDFLRMADVLIADLGDVNQAFHAAFEHGKSAEFRQAGNFGFNQLTDAQFIDIFLPRVFLEPADGQADMPFLFVDADHFYINFLPDFQHVAGVADAVPGDLAEMHQAVRTVDVHEGAKIRQAGHAPGADIADIHFFDHLVADRVACFMHRSFFGKDQPPALLVHFDDLKLQLFAYQLAESLFRCVSGDLRAP